MQYLNYSLMRQFILNDSKLCQHAQSHGRGKCDDRRLFWQMDVTSPKLLKVSKKLIF